MYVTFALIALGLAYGLSRAFDAAQLAVPTSPSIVVCGAFESSVFASGRSRTSADTFRCSTGRPARRSEVSPVSHNPAVAHSET
jgi:hypothetical protein